MHPAMRPAIGGLTIVLAVMASGGCLTLGPRCATRSVQINWTDGRTTQMPMTVCGFDWRIGEIPPKLDAEMSDRNDGSRVASLRRQVSRAKQIVRERLSRLVAALRE